MSDSARPKNEWDEDVEVFQMMEFLATNTSKAGDGGNFPATWYNQAADHIAAFKGPDGTTKTGDQVQREHFNHFSKRKLQRRTVSEQALIIRSKFLVWKVSPLSATNKSDATVQ